MQIDSVEKHEVFPTNPPSNGVYSFRGGFPTVQFQIASQDKFLVASTLRLNGSIRLQGQGGAPGTHDKPPTNGADGFPDDGIALNERVGVASCIHQVTLATQSNQTLEVIRNYGRWLASTQPMMHSQTDLDTNQQQGDPASASREQQSAFAMNNQRSFSIPLRTGLLNSGTPLPIGTNGLRGMLIDLQLAADSNAISGYNVVAADGTTTRTIFTPINQGAFYELFDLSLSYDLLVPDDNGLKQMSTPATGQLRYNSVSSLYGVLNSSDQTNNYNLGTANTLTVNHNFIPTTYINNYLFDGFGTGKLKQGAQYLQAARINRVSFVRAGSLYPLDYAIDVETQGINNRPQTELEIRLIDAVKPYAQYNHSLVSTNTQNGIPNGNTFSYAPTPRQRFTQAEASPLFGVGIRFDPLTNLGVNFKNAPYGVRIESALQGTAPNSIFTYVLAQNTLMYSPNGIMVQS